MSNLREQLRALRDAYGSIRYDGDLAADLSAAVGTSAGGAARPSATPSPARASWRWWAGAAGSLAAAAALVLLVYSRARLDDAPSATSGGVGMAVRTDDASMNPPLDAGVRPDDAANNATGITLADATPTLWNSFESAPSLFGSTGDGESYVPSFPSLSDVSEALQNSTSTEDAK